MKNTRFLRAFGLATALAAVLSSGSCGKQKVEECPNGCLVASGGGVFNCVLYSFFGRISSIMTEFSHTEFYVIKGVALDAYEYGRNVQLVEDLKGNFPKNVSEFTVWGNESNGAFGFRMDLLACSHCYKREDVLIMLLLPVFDDPWHIENETEIFEKEGDFQTLPCTYSVLKLKNGNVTGPIVWDTDSSFDAIVGTTKTNMSWINFQKELNNLLKSN